MESQAEFDAFYAGARTDLLTETLALTGDVTAARSAVRDAFAIAYHHWRKVRRLDDRVAWVRPYAWRRAQRHHQTRIWHRDKSLPEDARAVLDALGSLTAAQRRTLLLSNLTSLTLPEMARVVGLPQSRTEEELQAATSAFTLALDVPSSQVRHEFEALRRVAQEVTWPRVTIVRRTGAARRRTHTTLGVLGTVGVMLLGGMLAQSGTAGTAVLDADRINTPHDGSQKPPPQLDVDALLRPEQVARVAPKLTWTETLTTQNTEGDPVLAHCQVDRFADVKGLGTWVRTFEGAPTGQSMKTGKKKGAKKPPSVPASVMQTVELSRSPRAATATYRRVLGWYASCAEPRTQLVTTRRIRNVGERAIQFQLRTWGSSPGTVTVTVARTGQLTLTTVDRVARPRPVASAGLMLAAVNSVCGTDIAPTCGTDPRLKVVPPLSIGAPAGMLKVVDLPPVADARGTWVGTDPEAMVKNTAATVCDPTTFGGRAIRSATSRTFLFPRAKDPGSFGLTQVVARAKGPAARAAVAAVRDRMGSCADRNLAVKVTPLPGAVSSRTRDLSAWHLDVELNDDRSVQYLMAVVRHGNAVSQIGFVPTGQMTMSRPDFQGVARRALERLERLPR